MSFSAAIDESAAGDLIWVMEGTYTGSFQLRRDGTADHPIVFRARPGHRAVINGGIEITGAHTWIWGLEIIDPTGMSALDGGVSLLAPGAHVINNVIHDQWNKNGIGAWDTGSGQVIYGNVVYENGKGPHHPHNIYAQNDFDRYGHKYIIGNMLLDAADVCDDCFNFHAYTEGGFIRGLYVRGNVVKNGRFLIGGYNVPADREVVRDNFFYDADVQFGYARPTQVEFRDNFLARSSLATPWFWGEGETEHTQTAPNVYTGNKILLPPGHHVQFRTSAYLASGRCEGCPRIQSTDTFDGNTYTAPFTATFFADNTDLGTVDLATWRAAAAAAGNGFDGGSVLVEAPSGVTVSLIPNEYETGRGHLTVFNWSGAAHALVDLSSILSPNAPYAIYPAKDLFGTAVVSGRYQGPFELPIPNEEFSAYVVVPDAPNALPSVDAFLAPGAVFTAGQSMDLLADLRGMTVVDAYVAVVIPDGTFFTVLPGGALSAPNTTVPFSTGFEVRSVVDLPIFSYTFGGSEPSGTYTWLIILVPVGADPMNPANWVASDRVSFTFDPR